MCNIWSLCSAGILNPYVDPVRRRLLCRPNQMLSLYLILLVTSISCSSGANPSSDAVTRAKLPFGTVDQPKANQTLKGVVGVTGWALSESGIASVTIYVDRTFLAAAISGLPRPDVASSHPGISGNAAAGWGAEVDTSKLTAGWHELTVQVRDRNGGTRELGSMPVLVEQ